ncbi:MAG: type II toxin-antitoxin system VapC family toxin [Acidobacteriota bacterium]
MNLVDSSGWLEFFSDGPLADHYAEYLADPSKVLTPTVVLYEVYKWIKRSRSEEEALIVAARLTGTMVVSLQPTVALEAGDLSLEHGLAMADALIYATALHHQASVITSDADFEHLPGVVYLAKS